MPKKLSVVGNSLGLSTDKPVLKLRRIDKNTPLDVSTDGAVLVIARTERVRESALRIAERHAASFQKLAR